MNLPTREQAGVLIVSVSGRIDHNVSEEFTQALDPLLATCTQGRPSLLLDFSGVDYISSAGLRVLMMASRRAKTQQGVFAIAALQPMVQEVFAISRFNLIVPCHATVDAACKAPGRMNEVIFWGTRGSLPVALTHREVREKITGALIAANGKDLQDRARHSTSLSTPCPLPSTAPLAATRRASRSSATAPSISSATWVAAPARSARPRWPSSAWQIRRPITSSFPICTGIT